MRTYIFGLLVLLLVQVIFASKEYPFRSSHYGCPTECHTEKNPKCGNGLPSDRFFVALHPKYFKEKVHDKFKYCDHYWVGMIIDDKADGQYKLVRGKVVDQCGSCAETQVDLSQDIFKTIARTSTGIVNMVFVLVNKDTSEIIDGPHYNSEALKKFSSKHDVSRERIIESFKEAARNLIKQGGKGMRQYPWESTSFDKSTPKQKTTTKKTTTVHTKKTTVEVIKIKTSHVHTKAKPTTTTVKPAEPTVVKPAEEPVVKIEPVDPKPISGAEAHVPEQVVEIEPVDPTPLSGVEAHVPQRNEEADEEPESKEEAPKKIEENELDEFDKNNGGTNAPVTASVIGFGVVGAAGIGLLMLKRNKPQKYDELKQKFPEAFNNVKRSISRGASSIKRGVSRSVSRRGNYKNSTPLPASYSFTLSNEDGLPRVALYDDPYPTQASGSQHW